jgi:hypothetical protein
VLIGALIGLGTCGANLWLRLHFWRKERVQAEHALATKIDEVLQEFPQESQQWGGRGALREREIVQELLRDLEEASQVRLRPVVPLVCYFPVGART